MKHKDLIERVMKKLLNGDDTVLSLLRKQYECAEIASVEGNNVGFFVDYKVDKFHISENEYNNTFQLGDVDGCVAGAKGAVGFVLFIKDGYINMLEGYTNTICNWPSDEQQIELFYDTGMDRDISKLRKKWIK